MRTIETENYTKIAGKTERKKRDGTGPFEDSFQKKEVGEGKRKHKGEECPCKEEEEDKDK